MKRLLGGIAVVVLGIATILAVPFASQPAQAQNVNNFTINAYDIAYTLSRDESNRSVLQTAEVITALFPDFDQNHGIERMIPKQYNGHPTSLRINSITTPEGTALNYNTNTESSNFTVLRIGDADRYVQGLQVYNLDYSQRDVTRFYSDTNKDEWYWDTNGTQWRVPIELLTISIKIDNDIAARLQGEPFCYKGKQGSTDRCTLTKTSEGEYAITAQNLRAGENVSVAFGFTPGTFAPYEPSLFERLAGIWVLFIIATGIIGLGIFIWITAMFFRKKNRTNELHTIVVQYVPPRHTSVTVASQVITPSGSVFAAQLIDFAVRRYIAIIETKPKGTWSMAEYDISILRDPAGLLQEEQEILSDMFGSLPKVGDRLSLTTLREDTEYHKRLRDNTTKVATLIEGPYALRHKSLEVSKFFSRWAIGLGIAAAVTLSVPLGFLAGITALYGAFIRPLTDTGLEIRRYLLGLSKYIKAAEAERLAFLQAPDTADKIGGDIDPSNPGQVVKLYERVLPYAILFGHEKQWTKQLERFYQSTDTSPDWYVGSTAFNAGLFAGAVASFSSTASYSGGVDSSSSGGSSGGGSSGGGGGGGGGGGW